MFEAKLIELKEKCFKSTIMVRDTKSPLSEIMTGIIKAIEWLDNTASQKILTFLEQFT